MTSDWLGGGIIVAIAAGLWLIYLLPTWFKRNEYLATERNVVRLQQTLRILAETSEVPDEVRVEANARGVIEQQRLLKKVAVDHTPPALRAATHLRQSRAVTTGILAFSLLAVLLAGIQITLSGAWVVLALGLISSTLCLTRLARLSKDGRALRLRAPNAAEHGLPAVSQPSYLDGFDELHDEAAIAAQAARPTWTPVPLPSPLYAARVRSANTVDVPLAESVLRDADASLKQAALESDEALRAAQAASAASSRFTAMGVIDNAETGSFDLDQVLARRRAG